MKIYVASKFENKPEVQRILTLLRQKGHQITADWTIHQHVQPVTDQNRELATEYAIQDLNGTKECDIFIFLTIQAVGLGSTTEFGAALLSSVINKKPKVYVVGEYLDTNLFYIHPNVTIKKTIEEVIDELEK